MWLTLAFCVSKCYVQVELESKESGKTYVFICDRWLADDKDDNLTEVELQERDSKNRELI